MHRIGDDNIEGPRWDSGPDDWPRTNILHAIIVASLVSVPVWLLLWFGRYGAAAVLILVLGAFMVLVEVSDDE